jgi:putative nucleotidyltransferase with HDIG domain
MSGIALEQTIGEILASSREALGVSRARFYAMDASGLFRLSASYGFGMRSAPPQFLESGHPLVEWIQHHRKPTFANGFREAGVLATLMEKERYARSLTAPAYAGSRLVGILELQDKLGNAPFGPEDLQRAQRITGQIEKFLAPSHGGSVAASEPLAEEDREALFMSQRTDRVTEFPEPPELFSPAAEIRPPAARGAVSDTAPEPISRERILFRAFANTALLCPDVEAFVFSLWSRERAKLWAGARRPLSEAARRAVMKNVESAYLSIRPGTPPPSDRSWQAEFPLGRGSGEVLEPAGIQTSVIFSDQSTLLLSLLFSRPPTGTSEEALKETHRLIRASVLQARAGQRYHVAYRSLVDTLLEPGRRAYPQLKAHCLAVGALTRRFANVLRLPAETVEQLTVAALLHDVGLRELEIPYERLSGRRPLDLQELEIVRGHAAIGADLLSRIEFPYPIAPLVRYHHERFDGSGYPDRLAGDKIPFGSRVIAITEAYDAMVAPHSYRSPIPREAALDTLSAKAGSQFDPELARRFIELIRATAVMEEGEPLPEIRS